MRWLYSLLMVLAQPLLARRLQRRGQSEPGYLRAVPERFGQYQPTAHTGYIWIHAVSLGETHAAGLLLPALRAQMPGMRLLLTHGTATGREAGSKLLQNGDVQAWLPWDTPHAVQRFLQHFQPRLGVLIETEIWPNLVAQCARYQVPLVLANARMSEISWRRSQRLIWLAAPAYRALTAVWAQTADDALRLRRLGAPVQAVLGNLKFDFMPDSVQLARGRAWRAAQTKPVVMFASSRAGEELLLLQALQQNPAGQAWQWLIVPRHPQRFDAVMALCQAQGFSVSRRSAWGDAPRTAQLWLGDSMGEMALYYGLSDVALLGGSFAPLGGQNLVEAAACTCPVVMGPHTFNFAEIGELAVNAGAAFAVADMPHALKQVQDLLEPVARLDSARQAAIAFAGAHQGAAQRTAQLVALVAQRPV